MANRQISVQVDESLVDFADAQVESKQIKSRAQFVEQAMLREKRYQEGLRAAAIYREHGEDPDLVELIRYVAHRPLDID